MHFTLNSVSLRHTLLPSGKKAVNALEIVLQLIKLNPLTSLFALLFLSLFSEFGELRVLRVEKVLIHGLFNLVHISTEHERVQWFTHVDSFSESFQGSTHDQLRCCADSGEGHALGFWSDHGFCALALSDFEKLLGSDLCRHVPWGHVLWLTSR